MDVMTEAASAGSFDLFSSSPVPRANPAPHRRQPLELKVADALCRQLRRKAARREKQRIAHLICLNLVSLLKTSGAGQAPTSYKELQNG